MFYFKKCTKCGEYKNFDSFIKARQTYDGLQTRCRECYLKLKNAEYLKRHPDLQEKRKNEEAGLRKCAKCKDWKDVDDFGYYRVFKKGKRYFQMSYCRPCLLIKYRNNNKTMPARYQSKRTQAKNRGLDFTISYEEFSEIVSRECFYCNGFFKNGLVGLDRIDSNIGYVQGNLVPCCRTCNTTKMDNFTKDETKAMISTVIKMRQGEVLAIAV